MIKKLDIMKDTRNVIDKDRIVHTVANFTVIEKINEIITELNIILQEREHYCKVYEEVVKPAMLPEKKMKEETRPIPAYINGIGECIVYTTCDKCVDKFQIFKTSSGKIAIYCPCCGKVLKYEKRK